MTSRLSVAGALHDAKARLAAKKALKYPPVTFNGFQARAVGRGFSECVMIANFVVWACAILPDHAHLMIASHRLSPDRIAKLLKGGSTRRLVQEKIHPLAAYPMRAGRMPNAWARGQWKVFLDTPADVCRAVAYVEANSAKQGLPPQRWTFVKPYS